MSDLVTLQPAAGTPALTVLEWRPVERNTLKGFATIRIDAWRLVVADIAVHEARSHEGVMRWCQLPSKPILDKDRNLVMKDSKVQYGRVLWFSDDRVRRRFSDAVIDALAAYDETIFTEGGQ